MSAFVVWPQAEVRSRPRNSRLTNFHLTAELRTFADYPVLTLWLFCLLRHNGHSKTIPVTTIKFML